MKSKEIESLKELKHYWKDCFIPIFPKIRTLKELIREFKDDTTITRKLPNKPTNKKINTYFYNPFK